MIEITDIADKRIEPFLSLKDKSLSDNGLVILETQKVVEQAIDDGLEIFQVLAKPEFYEDKDFSKQVQCLSASQKVLNEIVGFRLHQGVLAIAKRPLEVKLDEMVGPIVFLNGITSPENVGTICRNLRAFGFSNLLLDHETLHPHARRSIRVSIGHSLKLNINQSLNSIGDLQLLKDRGYKLVAATLTDNSISLGKHQFNEKNVLILGSEGFGVKENILKICDLEVNIPISTDVDSLNVACASSILLHQFSVDTFN